MRLIFIKKINEKNLIKLINKIYLKIVIVVKKNKKMDIHCPICYDTYNDKDKIPRILLCGHTFCQVCLMDLRTSNILTCPTCRKFFSPEVKSLIRNFTLLGK